MFAGVGQSRGSMKLFLSESFIRILLNSHFMHKALNAFYPVKFEEGPVQEMSRYDQLKTHGLSGLNK